MSGSTETSYTDYLMAELSEYEKGRLANIEENNKILRSLGLLDEPTVTVNSKKKPKRKKRYTSDSSYSEDDWMPGRWPLEETFVNYKSIKKAPNLELVRKPDYQETDREYENDFNGSTLQKTKEPVNLTVPEERRYPKRRIEEIKYTEVELLNEAEYLFCENGYHGECPPLSILDPTTGYDQESTNYTSVPVPKELTVKPSTIPSAGLGVFATQPIPKGVRFGPCKRWKLYEKDIGHDVMEVKCGNDESHIIDGKVESDESNWMRYINCARNKKEQNLEAFQYSHDEEIHYQSLKCIYPGNELLAWYSDRYAGELEIIEKDDEDSQLVICKKCESSFVAQSSFNLHLPGNKSCFDANPQIFSCLRCGESFAKLHLLQHHIRKHEEERENAKTVIAESAQINESFWETCPYCDKEFSSKSAFKTHIRTHTGDKPYKCQYCDKGFTTNSSLKSHIRIHTGDKPYKCQYCGKGFNQKDHLKKHIRTHTGEKPYKCQYCGKGFGDCSSLKRHIRTHTGDKPYKCQYCGKGFNRNDYLKTHIRTHTGDKPYKCQYCGKGFSDCSSLKRHIQIHTGDKP